MDLSVLLFGEARQLAHGANKALIHCSSNSSTRTPLPVTVADVLRTLQSGNHTSSQGVTLSIHISTSSAPFDPQCIRGWAELATSAVLAVNQEYVAFGEEETQFVTSADEIALIPPVSGG